MLKISAFLLTALLVIPTLLIHPVSSIDTVEDSWTPKASMPTARSGLSAAVLDGKIYAMGGYDSHQELSSSNEMYDPIADNWTKLAPIPTARRDSE